MTDSLSPKNNKKNNDDNDNSNWRIFLSLSLIGILGLGVAIAALPQASAHITNNVAHMLEHIYEFTSDTNEKVNDPAFGLEAIKNAINNGADQASVDDLQSTVDDTKSAVDDVIATQYVPFSAMTPNTDPIVCVPEGETTQLDDRIIISTDSSDTMIIVNSVIIQPRNAIAQDDAVSVRFLTIDGHRIFISSGDLSPAGATPTNSAFDIMTAKSTFPHQVAGSTIQFDIACTHDPDRSDIDFQKVIVSGWKKADSSVSVTYEKSD